MPRSSAAYRPELVRGGAYGGMGRGPAIFRATPNPAPATGVVNIIGDGLAPYVAFQLDGANAPTPVTVNAGNLRLTLTAAAPGNHTVLVRTQTGSTSITLKV